MPPPAAGDGGSEEVLVLTEWPTEKVVLGTGAELTAAAAGSVAREGGGADRGRGRSRAGQRTVPAGRKTVWLQRWW